jgi:hypothetical protein
MQSHLSENATVWNSEQGAFISAAHERLAEVLHEYNPYFSLTWIPPKNRDASDTKPFAILNSAPGRAPHIIRYLSEAEMLDTTGVLAWIFEGDLERNRPNDVFARIEARENAEKMLQLKARMEEAESREDFANWVFGEGAGHAGFYAKHNGQAYNRQ